MARTAEWHTEYLHLENAEATAREIYRIADRNLHRRKPPVNARAQYDAAIDLLRVAGKARWDFEMAATTIIDISVLPARAWAAALRSA